MHRVFTELFPPSSISDAAFLPNFLGGSEALVLAQGNRLVVVAIEGGIPSEETRYELFGTITNVVPIRDVALLVLLSDLRSCILTYNEFELRLVTLSSGSLMPPSDISVTCPKFAVHPTVVVAQLCLHQLQVFPIDSSASLGTPFPISVGCRQVVDFVFIGPISKITRLAVLTREFNLTTSLRVIEIDPSEGSYSDDAAPNVSLPNDAYSILPCDPENASIIVAFSSQQAIRVLYNVRLTPQVTTATISTPSKLVKMVPMLPNFYVAIDSAAKVRMLKLEAKGTVHFVDIDTAPLPTALVRVTPTLAFVGSSTDDSVFFVIDPHSEHQITSVFSTIRQTGPVNKLISDRDQLIAICDRAIVECSQILAFAAYVRVEIINCTRCWTFRYQEGVGVLVTNIRRQHCCSTATAVLRTLLPLCQRSTNIILCAAARRAVRAGRRVGSALRVRRHLLRCRLWRCRGGFRRLTEGDAAQCR
jgi:hypothetical protein